MSKFAEIYREGAAEALAERAEMTYNEAVAFAADWVVEGATPNVRSVVSKFQSFSTEDEPKIYHRKVVEKVTKAGEPSIRKSEIVEMIAEELGVLVGTIEGLAKAPKRELENVLNALR